MTPLKKFFRQFRRHSLAALSTFVLLLLIVFSVAAPGLEMLLETDSASVNLLERYLPISLTHPLGTDELGRDYLVRLAYGGQVSLTVGLLAAVIAAAIGTTIGLISGYFGGWLDGVLMRLTDSVIALPLLPLLIVLAVIDLEKLGLPQSIADSELAGLIRIIIIVSLVGWTGVARLVRSNVLALREQPYVKAAMAIGAKPERIIVRHILPGIASPIIVATTLAIGNIILFESILSFLGLGINPPTPSWGNMLTNAQETIWQAPKLAIFPGLLIFLTVISINFIGDALQDALNTRSSIISGTN